MTKKMQDREDNVELKMLDIVVRDEVENEEGENTNADIEIEDFLKDEYNSDREEQIMDIDVGFNENVRTKIILFFSLLVNYYLFSKIKIYHVTVHSN